MKTGSFVRRAATTKRASEARRGEARRRVIKNRENGRTAACRFASLAKLDYFSQPAPPPSPREWWAVGQEGEEQRKELPLPRRSLSSSSSSLLSSTVSSQRLKYSFASVPRVISFPLPSLLRLLLPFLDLQGSARESERESKSFSLLCLSLSFDFRRENSKQR